MSTSSKISKRTPKRKRPTKPALFERTKKMLLQRATGLMYKGKVTDDRPTTAIFDLERDDDARGTFKMDRALLHEFFGFLRDQCDLSHMEVRVGDDILFNVRVPQKNTPKHHQEALAYAAKLLGMCNLEDAEFIEGISYTFLLAFNYSEKYRAARSKALDEIDEK